MSFRDDDGSENMDYQDNYKPVKNITVKNHIRKIDESISEIRKDCDENKKVVGLFKQDLNVLGHKTKEKCNELTKLFMDDLHNLEKEFKRTIQSDKSETDFFKQQLHALNTDKIKIKILKFGIFQKVLSFKNILH